MEFGSFPILTVSGFDILVVAECDKHVLGFIPGSWPTVPKTLSYKGSRSIFCSNEVAFAGSLASFRMGAGHQEDLGMVHWNLQSSPPPALQGDGGCPQWPAIQPCLHNGTSIKTPVQWNLGSSGLVNMCMCGEGGAPQEGMGTPHPFHLAVSDLYPS